MFQVLPKMSILYVQQKKMFLHRFIFRNVLFTKLSDLKRQLTVKPADQSD